MNRASRPLSITILACYSIISSVCAMGLYPTTVGTPKVREMMERNLLPVAVQIGFMYVGAMVLLVCAIGWLNGLNWSRWFYVIWCLFGAAVGAATYPYPLFALFGLAIQGIFWFFLFRPAANRFFVPAPAEAGADQAATEP